MSPWFIVQTNPNCECKAVAELRRAGFRAYLPTRAVYRRRKDDLLPIKRRPALVGYVFVRFPATVNFYALRRCQGVRGVLYLNGAPYRLKHGEVAAIMLAQRAMRFDDANAREVRRAWRDGQRNERRIFAAAKFLPGTTVSGPNGMLARVVEVTKRGTVKAIATTRDRDFPIEFTSVETLRVVDQSDEAA